MRPIADAEFGAWHAAISGAFSDHPSSTGGDEWRAISELDRSIAVLDAGEIVGSAGAFTFELTVPGGRTLPAAGVTAVGVRHTHRRRGILNRMMRHQLDDVAARGEPLAVLTASETVIYGRYGYGMATHHWGWNTDTAALDFAVRSRAGGRVRVIDKVAAAKVLPGILDRSRLRHPGGIAWSPARWDTWLADRESDRGGATAHFYLVHESDAGEPDGFVVYNVKHRWDHGLPDHTVNVLKTAALGDEIEAALFEHLVTVDLIRHVAARGRPVNDHLLHRLANSRRLKVGEVGDHLWLRVLDVPRALAGRDLGADDRLVLSIADAFLPSSGGTYVVSPDACVRDDAAAPDLAMGARDLGAVYLGGVTPTTLTRAGRIVERTPGAAARADRLFGSSQTPWCDTEF